MKFFLKERKRFDDSTLPVLYSLMKLSAGIMTEVVNIYLLCTLDNVMDCLLNLLAL